MTAPDEAAPYWDGLARGALVLPVCEKCGEVIWYPRSWCPACGGDVTWRETSGRGTVYSFTVIRKSAGEWRDRVPYVVAFVELAEGPRVLTNIAVDDVAAVTIGMEVVAALDGGSGLRFRPAATRS